MILKLCADVVATSLTSIINKSISLGRFPQTLKHAKVTAIHKGGPTSIPSNYRPISVLCTISKLFEKHVSSNLYAYFHDKKLLHTAQSGFRKGHSCQTALT